MLQKVVIAVVYHQFRFFFFSKNINSVAKYIGGRYSQKVLYNMLHNYKLILVSPQSFTSSWNILGSLLNLLTWFYADYIHFLFQHSCNQDSASVVQADFVTKCLEDKRVSQLNRTCLDLKVSCKLNLNYRLDWYRGDNPSSSLSAVGHSSSGRSGCGINCHETRSLRQTCGQILYSSVDFHRTLTQTTLGCLARKDNG